MADGQVSKMSELSSKRRVAIVTGASSGVGREFARQLDGGAGGQIDELWLVARSRERLEEVAAQCGHPTRIFALDLTKDESIDVIEAELAEASPTASGSDAKTDFAPSNGEAGATKAAGSPKATAGTAENPPAEPKPLQVTWLVNSAGFGKFGRMWEIGREQNANMVKLNCVALTALCSAALPYMGPGSRIVNLASVAGLMPQPELSVYCATKSFVFDLTRTLDYELRGTGIHATALCPKFMDTRFLESAGEPQAVRRMTSIGFEDVGRAVSRGIAAARKGRAVCIPSPDMRAAYALSKVLPGAAMLRAQDLLFTLRRGPSAPAKP